MPSQRPHVRATFHDADDAANAPDQPSHEESSSSVETRLAARPRFILAAVALVLLAIACGAAGVSPRFIYRDDQLITNNPVLQSWTGLRAIWGQPHHMPRLYPMSLSVLLVQHQFFHDLATGYRVVNLLLHAINVLLLWTLLRRLELRGAWLAASL